MIPPVPRWVWGWAIALPFAAGSTNAIALLSLGHGGVTHLTGISTEGAIALSGGDLRLLGHAAAVIACFTLGCALSAWVVRATRWTPSKGAAAMFLAEALLLATAALTFDADAVWATLLCALGIGLQNGTTSLVTGAVLRTSHVTGMFTDVGIVLGQWARRAAYDPVRLRICGVVIATFVAGGVAGTLVFARVAGLAMAMPAALAAACGLWTLRIRPAAS